VIAWLRDVLDGRPVFGWSWRPGPLRCGYGRLIGCAEVTGGEPCDRHKHPIQLVGEAMLATVRAMGPTCAWCDHSKADHSTVLVGAPCLRCSCPGWWEATPG
jgi:hypothetical protein